MAVLSANLINTQPASFDDCTHSLDDIACQCTDAERAVLSILSVSTEPLFYTDLIDDGSSSVIVELLGQTGFWTMSQCAIYRVHYPTEPGMRIDCNRGTRLRHPFRY